MQPKLTTTGHFSPAISLIEDLKKKSNRGGKCLIEDNSLAKLNFDRAGQFVIDGKGNWSILVFLDCRSHIRCFRGRMKNESFCI